jgi:hypothetical protein
MDADDPLRKGIEDVRVWVAWILGIEPAALVCEDPGATRDDDLRLTPSCLPQCAACNVVAGEPVPVPWTVS